LHTTGYNTFDFGFRYSRAPRIAANDIYFAAVLVLVLVASAMKRRCRIESAAFMRAKQEPRRAIRIGTCEAMPAHHRLLANQQSWQRPLGSPHP
jgi:hypothetical protein